MQYEKELALALAAAEEAAAALRDAYERFAAIPDAPASISTEADRLSQEIILTRIRERFPSDALCAEESTPTLAAAPQTGPRLWVVDPIDGTRGFARKNGEFSVMIAFVEGGQMAAGVVLEPVPRRLTFARRGGGCWRRDADGPVVSCHVTDVADLSAATLTQSHSGSSRKVELLRPARVRATYSAGIKLALVARGEADVYLNTYDGAHDWDLCAGHLLVEEAGGRVTGLRREEIRYGLPGALQRCGVLATNGRLHEEALQRLL